MAHTGIATMAEDITNVHITRGAPYTLRIIVMAGKVQPIPVVIILGTVMPVRGIVSRPPDTAKLAASVIAAVQDTAVLAVTVVLAGIAVVVTAAEVGMVAAISTELLL